MNKKIILAVMFTLSGTQPAVAMQAGLSSMLTSIKSTKNPTLVAGGALAAVTTLAGLAKHWWINRDFAPREKVLCDQQKLNKAAVDSAQNEQAKKLAQEAWDGIHYTQNLVADNKARYKAQLWRPMALGYLSSLALMVYGLYQASIKAA
jgi:hypothetical protein